MNGRNEYEYNIRHSGLKNTKHRAEILQMLEQSPQPVAAEDIYMRLQHGGVSINLSTVYRILDAFAAKNLLNKLSLTGDSRTLYEYNRMAHRHYLICISCKKIEAIDACPLKEYQRQVTEQTHFEIVGHKLDMFGYCPECRKKGLTGDKIK